MIVKRDVSGNFSAGTISAALSGNATTATTASAVPWSGVTGKPTTISGITGVDSVDANPNVRLPSGFYQTSVATTANGWPESTGSWWHLLASTHSNVTNNYSMQFASDFFSNKLYYRSTN